MMRQFGAPLPAPRTNNVNIIYPPAKLAILKATLYNAPTDRGI
jgi:hypothetical protein